MTVQDQKQQQFENNRIKKRGDVGVQTWFLGLGLTQVQV